MIPWEHLATSSIPGSEGDMKLMRRGAEYSIMLGQIELMNSRLSGSEEALARLSVEKIAGRAAPTIVVGGLGMGFTLRALLAVAPEDARIVVCELVPAVVAWARGEMAHIFEGCLDDPRVEIVVRDVAELMAETQSHFDAILLDVDNGPEGLTSDVNDALYAAKGLGEARRALKPGGVLAVWSQGPDERFAARLRKSAFDVEEVRVKAHRGKRGARHVIWFGTKPDA
ncbi:spermidine synthase [Jiella mangrovi]|uniref:Methyltransferase domain-containing protein n=1 Tax=Jiella mangrovi TaxID=2821407 RepID=A0ABS4BN22_9HYPH|nr:methyltransferase domain-containing protein [Jiella mangrovi]MBP0618137.1 methyltransferase domain-containing protein [Jiella mangrovi]